MIFPGFSLFWLAVLTDLFLVFTHNVASSNPYRPASLPFPASTICEGTSFSAPERDSWIMLIVFLLFKDMESSAFLGYFSGEYY